MIIHAANMVTSEDSRVLSVEAAPTSKDDAISDLAETARELQHSQ